MNSALRNSSIYMILRGLLGFKETNAEADSRAYPSFPVVPKADRRLSMLGEDMGEVNRIFGPADRSGYLLNDCIECA
jgi:hypothetical protein